MGRQGQGDVGNSWGKKSLPLSLDQNPSPAISYTLSRLFILARVYPDQLRCRARISVVFADDWKRTKERVWDAAAEVELWWGPRGASLHASSASPLLSTPHLESNIIFVVPVLA
jgi:hypothetical protein